MVLGELIAFLESLDPTKVLPWGFGEPSSYRGFYEDVAFEPAENVTVASMLAHAKSALGNTFEGYKGGDFQMDALTDCWISRYWEASGDKITITLTKYIAEYANTRTVGG